MPDDPKRLQVLDAVRVRLEQIQTTDPRFATNAGLAIAIGAAPELGPDDATEVIALRLGDDQPQYQGEQVYTYLPIEIEAVVSADLARPWRAAELVLGDIKRAMELPDRTLGGVLKEQLRRGGATVADRQPGSSTVGVQLVYVARLLEVWGNP